MNIANLVAARAHSAPDSIAIIHRDKHWTYRELLQQADAYGEMIRALLPVNPHTRIALYCPNGPDYIALALGILRTDACFIPVPSELAIPERLHLLQLTAPHAILAISPQPWFPEKSHSTSVGASQLHHCILQINAPFPEDRFAALHPAFIRFSSGTTGTSKGVVISHESLLSRIRSANRRLAITPTDRVLWILPMAHHFAVSIMLYLIEGATTVLEDSHLAAEVLTSATHASATVFYGSPFHLALLAAEDSHRVWPSLRLAVGTAAPVPERISSAFKNRYGIPPAQGFGIIEIGLPLLNTDAPSEKPESIGRSDEFEISLRTENGSEAARGELGELHLRGPGMFDAYLAPWAERDQITTNGWFATGDLAAMDAEGHIFLRGRKKTVINFGGMKFFPEEVEDVLNSHPDVRESRVAGEAHERWGTVAIAEIVPLHSTAPPAFHSLAKFCREQLATYKVPVRFRLVTEIPRTASGKIRR